MYATRPLQMHLRYHPSVNSKSVGILVRHRHLPKPLGPSLPPLCHNIRMDKLKGTWIAKWTWNPRKRSMMMEAGVRGMMMKTKEDEGAPGPDHSLRSRTGHFELRVWQLRMLAVYCLRAA